MPEGATAVGVRECIPLLTTPRLREGPMDGQGLGWWEGVGERDTNRHGGQDQIMGLHAALAFSFA